MKETGSYYARLVGHIKRLYFQLVFGDKNYRFELAIIHILKVEKKSYSMMYDMFDHRG